MGFPLCGCWRGLKNDLDASVQWTTRPSFVFFSVLFVVPAFALSLLTGPFGFQLAF